MRQGQGKPRRLKRQEATSSEFVRPYVAAGDILGEGEDEEYILLEPVSLYFAEVEWK